MHYATRNHAFLPAQTWVLDEANIRIEDDKGPPRVVPLAAMVEVRLAFAPTRPERERYRCQLVLRNAEVLEFFNRTYRGVYDFADTSAEYSEFVRALHAALGQHAPGCRFLAGSSGAGYAFNLLVLGFVVLVVAGAFVYFVVVGLVWIALIKVLLVLFYTPTAIRWAQRNKPRTYPPDAIPSDMLPVAPARAGSTPIVPSNERA